ncbi:transposase, partial [Paenibacillus darwinianus]
LEYPLSYKVWRKPAVKGDGPTKLDLAKEMLLALRQSTKCRLWVAMDRWYLCKDFFNFLTGNRFDWVTKAKRNTALFRKQIHPLTGRERYEPVNPAMLIKEVFTSLSKQGQVGLVGISVPDIYMKMPHFVSNRKGEHIKKYRYTAIAAVVAMRLKEDEEPEAAELEDTDEDKPATYRGAYVLISNRADAADEVLHVYAKRWRIEVFFRRAKQNLGLAKCHSTTEEHHHAHLELLFAADTLLGFAHWEMNKEKTSDGDGCTHGEMVRCLFHTRCQIRSKTRSGTQTISLDIGTEAVRFARLIQLFWPNEIRMFWGESAFSHVLPASA